MINSHSISPEHQQALRAGEVTWSEDGLNATCGHYHGAVQWSENRIGWYTSEAGEWRWINTRMGVVPAGVVKRYESIAREYVEQSLRRQATATLTDVLDNPDVDYQPLNPAILELLRGQKS